MDLSRTIDSLQALGIDACNCGNSDFILSTVSMILAPACLFMINKIAGWLSLSPADRKSSTESRACPRSDKRMAAPFL